MGDGTLTLVNLNTGETLDTSYKLQDNKFGVRGHKMYNNGVFLLADKLTKNELKFVIGIFGSNTVDRNNILTNTFRECSKHMSDSVRSRLKKKLIDSNIFGEYNNKLMLNPYIFVARGDRNKRNSMHLIQQTWKYIFEDASLMSDDIVNHARKIFGDIDNKKTYIMIGKDKNILKSPTSRNG